jgi:hypothetical protein
MTFHLDDPLSFFPVYGMQAGPARMVRDAPPERQDPGVRHDFLCAPTDATACGYTKGIHREAPYMTSTNGTLITMQGAKKVCVAEELETHAPRVSIKVLRSAVAGVD